MSRTLIGAMVSNGPATPIVTRNVTTPIASEESAMIADGAPAGWRYGASRCHYNFINAPFNGGFNGSTITALSGNAQADFENDRLPVVTMKTPGGNGGEWANVTNGTYNAMLDQRADEIIAWQNQHRGLGKWGATFVWSFHHEPNGTDESAFFGGSMAATGTAWIAATRYIYERWAARGVTIWDGESDWTTYTEGLILSINLVDGRASGQVNADSKNYFWGPTNGGPGPGDAWMDAHCIMFTTDPYPTGQMWPFSNLVSHSPGGPSTGPGTLTNTIRSWSNAKRVYQESQGHVFLEGILETGSRQVPGSGRGTVYTAIPQAWTDTGLAPTEANWIIEMRNYIRDSWPTLNLLCYWDDRASGWYEIDLTPEAWAAAIATFTDEAAYASASTPLPSGSAPAPVVDAPTVLQSTAIINSQTPGTVFNSSAFNIGADELVLFWTEGERNDSVVPGIPTMSFPTAPSSGTNPSLTRIAAADSGWSVAGTYRPQQGLWVASTVSSGPVEGAVLRVTWPGSVGGCTVVMERIVGADLSGAVSAAIVGAPVKATVSAATAVSVTLPTPANARNRSFALTSHRQNESTSPFGASPVTFAASPAIPTANKLQILIGLGLSGGGQSATVATVTGRGLTWSRVRSDNSYGNHLEEIWVAVGAAPTNAPMAFTWNADGTRPDTTGYWEADLIECTNADISNGGLGAIGTVVVQNSAIDTGFTIPFSYQRGANARVISACLLRGDGGIAAFSTTHAEALFGPLQIFSTPLGTWVGTEVDSGEASQAVNPASYGFGGALQVHNYGALVIEVGPVPALAEGTDVVRTSPVPVGVATAHSVGAFQAGVGESWTTSTAGGLVGIEVAAGPPASGVRLGATSAYISTFETMLGRSVDTEKVLVADTGATFTWGTGGWVTAAAADASGHAVFVACSLGANTWSQIAAGNIDSYLITLAANLAAFSQPGVFCYFPEAEVASGRGTSAQYRQAATHVINLLRPLMPGWRFANTLQDLSWFNMLSAPYTTLWNGATPTDWMVPEADILAVNAFNRRGATFSSPSHPYANPAASTYADISPSVFTSGWVATAIAQAKTLMLAEFGCAVDDPAVNSNGHTARAAWIGSAMSAMKGKVEAVHYADLDSADGRINLRISGGVKTAEQDSVDAFKTGSASVSLTKSHTTTAIIRKAATKSHTTTAIVRKTIPKTHSSDAVMKRPFVITHTADAIISKSAVVKTHTTDAFITSYVLVSHVTSAQGAGVSSVVVG